MSYLTGDTPVVATSRQHLWDMVREIMMFKGHHCDLNHIDVSGVQDFSLMFGSVPFNGDVSRWNMSNAVDLAGMFEQSHFDGDLSHWDTSNVEHMSFLFAESSFNNDSIANWNVAKVKSMHWMFRKNAVFNQDLRAWTPSSLQDASSLFQACPYTKDISMWRLDALNTCEGMLDPKSLVQMPTPGLYHWYALLDDNTTLRGHPQEALLQEHMAKLGSVMAGLGFSQLDAARWLAREWNASPVPDETISLPMLY